MQAGKFVGTYVRFGNVQLGVDEDWTSLIKADVLSNSELSLNDMNSYYILRYQNLVSLCFRLLPHQCENEDMVDETEEKECNEFMAQTMTGWQVDLQKSGLDEMESSRLQSMFFDKDDHTMCIYKK